ncbi:MAG: multidrug effflux MFS transporter [Aestuariibacter sp.]
MPTKRLGQSEFIVLFALLMSLTAMSLDAMLPALPQIGRDLGVDDLNKTQLVISMLILGTVFGELFFGPISDAIGRRKTILIGILIFLSGTLVAIFAETLQGLLIGRIIQGFGVSGSRIGSRALVRDLYAGAQMARVMSFIMMIFIIVPMVAPAIGQIIMLNFGWRAIFVSFLIHAALMLLWFGIRQSETLPKERRIPLSLSRIWTSAGQIVRHRKVMAYTLLSGLVFGAMVLYLSVARAMFEDLYQKGDDFPLLFAILALGIGIAAIINGKIVIRFGMHKVTSWALIGILIFSSILVSTSLWHQGAPPFLLLMVLLATILFFVGFIFGNINAMCMEWLGGIAGIGASIVGSLSSSVAVLLAVLVGPFYQGTVMPLAYTYLAVGVGGLVLLRLAKRADAVHL